MMIIFTNLAAAIGGSLALYFFYPPLLQLVAWILSIPYLGSILRFGLSVADIALPQTCAIAIGVVGWAAYNICRPTKRGYRFGMGLLGIDVVVQFAPMVISLFRNYGFDFSFLALALVAGLGAVLMIMAAFRSAQEPDTDIPTQPDFEERINDPELLLAELKRRRAENGTDAPLSSEEFYRLLDEQNAKLDADRRNEHRDHRKFSVVETIEDR